MGLLLRRVNMEVSLSLSVALWRGRAGPYVHSSVGLPCMALWRRGAGPCVHSSMGLLCVALWKDRAGPCVHSSSKWAGADHSAVCLGVPTQHQPESTSAYISNIPGSVLCPCSAGQLVPSSTLTRRYFRKYKV